MLTNIILGLLLIIALAIFNCLDRIAKVLERDAQKWLH